MEKECFKCGEVKPLTEFYKHKAMLDGHLNKCKDCAKKDVSDHRANNIEKIREYDRNRPNKKDRVVRFRKYMLNLREHNPQKYEYHKQHKKDYIAWIAVNDVEKYKTYTDKQRQANKIWRKSVNHVHSHVQRKLQRSPNCEKCGVLCKTQGHHEDYSKPLDVIWLCTKCHADRHIEIRNNQRNSA